MDLPMCAQCKRRPVPSAKAKYCGDTCRKRARRARGPANVVAIGVAAPDQPEVLVGTVEAATTAKLEAVDRLATPAGTASLVLARRLDMAGADTGSAVAAMVREFRATLAEATAGAVVEVDGIDELRERREARLAGR